MSQGSSFDDVAAFLLEALGVETAELLKTAEAKIAQILAGLTENRCLLVLDNLEDILYPASHPEAGKAVSSEWGELLHSCVYSRHCSTIIITSREFPNDLTDRRSRNPKPNPKLVEVCTVGGVSDADGVKILRQYGLRDCEADLKWIAERVKGNAFILTQLAAIGAESPGYLRKHPELVTEEAEPIIRAQLERQSEAARELLKWMCVLRVGIDVQGLTFLRLYEPESKDERFEEAIQLGRPVEFTKSEIRETEEIIKRLVNSSLLQRRYDKKQCDYFYDLHRLILEFMQREHETKISRILENAYRFYSTLKNSNKPQSIEDLSPLIELQYFAFQLQNYDESFDLLKHYLKDYLKLWGKWILLKELCEQHLLYVNEYQNIYCRIVIGEIERDLGNLEVAKKDFEDCLSRAREQNNTETIMKLLSMIGNIYMLKSDFCEAQYFYQESLKLANYLKDYLNISICYGELGNLEVYWGNLDKGENLYRKALKLLKKEENLQDFISIYSCLGDVKYFQKKWGDAEEIYWESLILRKELRDISGIADSYASIGDIEKEKGNFNSARYFYKKYLEIKRTLNDRLGIAMAIGCIGGLEMSQDNLDIAEQLLHQSLVQLQEFDFLRGVAEVNYDLALLYQKRRNDEKAQEYYNTACQLYQKMGSIRVLERIEREWNSPE
uniref:Tetratricopeptide repeat protein n=1 Tax=Desertifilum tharense IPPAS B-1220 TaxID=1781255 RepID=A0ACD5GQG6_9CYAN